MLGIGSTHHIGVRGRSLRLTNPTASTATTTATPAAAPLHSLLALRILLPTFVYNTSKLSASLRIRKRPRILIQLFSYRRSFDRSTRLVPVALRTIPSTISTATTTATLTGLATAFCTNLTTANCFGRTSFATRTSAVGLKVGGIALLLHEVGHIEERIALQTNVHKRGLHTRQH